MLSRLTRLRRRFHRPEPLSLLATPTTATALRIATASFAVNSDLSRSKSKTAWGPGSPHHPLFQITWTSRIRERHCNHESGLLINMQIHPPDQVPYGRLIRGNDEPMRADVLKETLIEPAT